MSQEATKKSIRGMKSHLTRRIGKADKLIALAENVYSSNAIAKLQTYEAGIQEQYNRIEAAYNDLIEGAADDYEALQHEASLNKENERATDAINKILKALADVTNTATPTPARAPEYRNSDKVKPNKVLEPFVLSRDHSVVEMSSWVRKFKAWYSASGMKNGPIQEQQAYFQKVIDIPLESKLSEFMQETTPIFVEEEEVSCMSILENEFLLQYLMLTRQVDFFSSCQEQGQSFSDWAADLRKLGDEAGLSSLTVDEIYMMRYFTGVTDMDLRKKFFKEIGPNLKKLNAIVKQHEIGKSNKKSISTKCREVMRKISYDSDNRYKREPSQRKVCARCGCTGHSPDDCRHKNAICHNCQGKCLLSGVCLELKKKKEQKIKTRLVLNGSSVPSEDISVSSNVEQSDEDDVESIRVLVRVCKTSKDSPRINVAISGSGANFDFKACADTGTSRSIIG